MNYKLYPKYNLNQKESRSKNYYNTQEEMDNMYAKAYEL